MNKLSIHLKKYFESRKDLKVIISDSNIPGEGEHKLLKHLRENYKENDFNMIYGLDADLICYVLLLINQIYIY